MRAALAQTLEVLGGVAVTAGAVIGGGLVVGLVVGGVIATVFGVALERGSA